MSTRKSAKLVTISIIKRMMNEHLCQTMDKEFWLFFSKGQKMQTWTHWYSERIKKKQIEYYNGIKISELCWDKIGNAINYM